MYKFQIEISLPTHPSLSLSLSLSVFVLMSTRNLPGVKGRPALKADNITAIVKPIV
jgi:hypothetical protein